MFNWNMGGLEGICVVEKIQGWNFPGDAENDCAV